MHSISCSVIDSRISSAAKLAVTVAGVIRGFDAMEIVTQEGKAYALVAADGAVPYRTQIRAVEAYSGHAVAEALERDFVENGAPLVIRLDRARMHAVPAVRDVLRRFGVSALQGPAYWPQFYGQLERQNRDHRAWLDRVGPLPTLAALQSEIDEMVRVFNGLWRRAKLGWCTPAEVWRDRPSPEPMRQAFQADVASRAAALESDLERRGRVARSQIQELAQRFAIEQTLKSYNFWSIEPGGLS